MTSPTMFDLPITAITQLCTESLTRFVRAHPLAPRLNKLSLTLESYRREIVAPETHVKTMMAEYFAQDATLQRGLDEIWTTTRPHLPGLVRSVTLELEMVPYVHTERGTFYACEKIETRFNRLSTNNAARALRNLHLLAPSFVPEENALQSWLIMSMEEGALTYSGEMLDAGTEEEAAFIYAALRLPEAAFQSLLGEGHEDISDRLSSTHFVAEPSFTARDFIAGSTRRFAVPA